MAIYHFSGQAVVSGDDILEGATGGTFVDASGVPIPIYDLNDTPISTITSNAFGLSSSFKADVPMGYIKFGDVLNRVFADEIAQFAVNAQAAIDDATAAVVASEAALTAAQQALVVAQQALVIAETGGGGGGLPVDTDLDDIPDGVTYKRMTVGERNKLATVAQGATALAIGTTSTTAKAGSWFPTPAEINAVRNKGGVAVIQFYDGVGEPAGMLDTEFVIKPQ